jgi:Tol biopolymer transport system component
MLITSKRLMTLSVLLTGILFLITACNDDNPTKYNPPIIEVNYPPIDQYPSWSPDGSKILYYHLGITQINSDGSYTINPDSAGLWIVNSDGSNPRLIMKGANIYADWSSEGSWIVFEQNGQIYKAPFINDSIDKAQITQLTFEGRNFFPTWSPDGQWIAYDSNVDSPNGMQFIWKMKNNGTQKLRISYEPTKGEIRMPYWSKMEDKILHIRWFGIGTPEIFEMSSSGNDLKRITHNNEFERFPKYSFDGTYIIFESTSTQNYGIWLFEINTGNSKRVADWAGQGYLDPSGEKIVCIGWPHPHKYNPRINGTVWIMNSDGTNKQQLTFGPGQ